MSAVSEQIVPGLGGVPETLLIPLWARAAEQRHANPIIHDPEASRIVASLDYDFECFRKKRVEVENFCIRARVMDQLVSGILKQSSPRRRVVEFGPGLDTRCSRIGAKVPHWLEVDLPEVISLRSRFLPATGNRTMVGSSMLDDAWIEAIREKCDGPPLFIAEGVFYFFSKEQIREFMKRLSDAFPGSDLVFDAVSSWYLKLANLRHPLSSSRLQFSLRSHAAEIPEWDAGFGIKNYIGFGDSPAYDDVIHRFPMWKRVLRKICPYSRHAFMVVHVGMPAEVRQA
jgi:O-methyltransferase involved in polyketide biosynthesis